MFKFELCSNQSNHILKVDDVNNQFEFMHF